MDKSEKTLENLSSADYQLVSDFCDDFGVVLDNIQIKIIPMEQVSVIFNKYTRDCKNSSDVSINVKVVCKNIDILNFLVYLLDVRKCKVVEFNNLLL